MSNQLFQDIKAGIYNFFSARVTKPDQVSIECLVIYDQESRKKELDLVEKELDVLSDIQVQNAFFCLNKVTDENIIVDYKLKDILKKHCMEEYIREVYPSHCVLNTTFADDVCYEYVGLNAVIDEVI